MNNLKSVNKYGETPYQAQINSRKELDQQIPLIQPKVHSERPHWVNKELKRLKKAAKFDMAAKLGEVMFKGAFPNILKRYKKEYQQVIKLA
jgi:hypothetical protein